MPGPFSGNEIVYIFTNVNRLKLFVDYFSFQRRVALQILIVTAEVQIFPDQILEAILSGNSSGPQIKVSTGKLFSLFLIKNICCGYSTEPSH